ncbi:MAG: nitrilase-related carbon-nitrogen hydrolase, partial [Candidatus Dormibacteria bacterium]
MSESSLKLAVGQYAPRVGDLEFNLAQGAAWITRAAEAGAQLVVLPELASSGYTFESEAEAERSAAGAAESETLARWAGLCRELGVFVAAGFAERGAQGRYNSAALLGPGGLIGVYRKAHLFFDEKTYFLPGDVGLPVFELPFGRVGLLVCYDLWFPEAARTLALGGADLICVPTNWVANFRGRWLDDRGWTMGDYACVGAALQNQVFVAAADRIGSERGVDFVGCSCVVGPDGWMLAGPAPYASEALLLADVDLEWARRNKRRTPRNHTFED